MLTAFELEQASSISARRVSAPRTGQPTKPDTSPSPDAPRFMRPIFLIVVPPGLTREWIAACLAKVDGERGIEFAQAQDPAPSLLRDGKAGLVFLDLDIPDIDRLAVVRTFAARCQGAPLVVLSSAMDEVSIDEAMRAGAVAYIPRSYTESQMLGVLRLVLDGAGHRPHLPGQRQLAVEELGSASPPPGHAQNGEAGWPERKLTPKQVEVLSLAADGLSNKQIAARLNITEGTVKLHMSAIYTKLNVDRRGEAIVIARRLEEVRAQQMRRAERGQQVLDWLLPHVTHRHAHKGEVIFRKGDPSRELYYIQRGTVTLQEIGVEMGAREIFGEIGVFSPEHARTCTALCKTDVELFCLDSEQVKSIYYLNPQFALHVVQLISQRLLADQVRTK
jgi:DNA-binding NarL/FixJ family response regulator